MRQAGHEVSSEKHTECTYKQACWRGVLEFKKSARFGGVTPRASASELGYFCLDTTIRRVLLCPARCPNFLLDHETYSDMQLICP